MADLLRYLTILLASMTIVMGWAHIQLYLRANGTLGEGRPILVWSWVWYVAALLVIGLASIDFIGEPLSWITVLRPIIVGASLVSIIRLYGVRKRTIKEREHEG